jgi:hypothetical protein
MALHEDLVIPQGKTWTGPIWALLTHDNTAVDLTGKTVHAQVRATVRDSVVLHEWSTELGNVEIATATVTIVDEAGEPLDITTAAIALTVRPTVSSAWSWRSGVYDVEVHNPLDPDDVWSVVDRSNVQVDPEVTRG